MRSNRGAYQFLTITLLTVTALAGALTWRGSAQLTPPTASATTGDFDEDGVPDIVTATRDGAGGRLELRRGNVAAIFPHGPNCPHGVMSATRAPFFEAVTLDSSAPADFIGAGDFDADSHLDIVAAERGGRPRADERRADSRQLDLCESGPGH